MPNKQTLFCGTCPDYLDEFYIKEANASNSASAFRIPSLINADGTLVAAVDKGATSLDWGFIELAVRRSEDGGKTWSDIQTIATPPARVINSRSDNIATAFYIDPCMAYAPNGDIILLVTFYPESKGLHNRALLDKKKVAYAKFDNEICPLIYDRDGNYFYILSDGKVIDSSKRSTDYRVNFTDGELYKADEYIGNIFLNGARGKNSNTDGKTTFGAPLKAAKRSYVFMLKSTDKGKIWSKPVDITGSILNQSTDGTFLGVAPGSAVTTTDGRLIFPLYTLNGSVSIYSDDNGETWHRNNKQIFTPNIDEWTLAEGPDGNIYSFSRSKRYGKTPFAISYDNAITFVKQKRAPFKAPKCQKNCLVIDDRIYVSHPSAKKRSNGVISAGTFKFDKKGNFKSIAWEKDDIVINDGFFAYSCMAQIDEHTIGILYEDQPGSHLVFETISV